MRKPLQPNITRLSTADVNNDGKLQRAALVRVSSDGKIVEQDKSMGRLLLNPETWEESIVSNWVSNNIPGQSNPILQWAGGGPRSISFEALVTKDTSDFLKKDKDPLTAAVDAGINAVGSIASSFFNVNVPPLGSLFGGFGDSQEGEQLGIHNELNHYRSLLYPKYVAGTVDTSPPLLVLYAGKTFSTKNTLPTGAVGANSDVWVLTELRVRITKQLPNLTPMEAVVSFKLIQYPITAIGSDHFGQNPISDVISGGGLSAAISGLFR